MLRVESHNGRRWLADENPVVQLKYFSEGPKVGRGTIFVLASGPSLADFPLARYKGYPVMAMNGSILRCVDEGIRPVFYLCDDLGFVLERSAIALQGLDFAGNVAMSFAALNELYRQERRCLSEKSIFLLERVNRFVGVEPMSDRAYSWSVRNDTDLVSRFSIFSSRKNRIGFSKNMDKGYFVARTIPYVAIQLAYSLGFSRVCLVGVDLQPALGRFYEPKSSGLPSTLDDDYKDYILPSFEIMSKKVVGARFEVLNLSANSRLPGGVVPKVTLDELDCLLARDRSGCEHFQEGMA